MASLRWPSAVALAIAITASPSAQQAFRTASNVVAVDASVYDKNGQPVTTLTAADFRIFEDGVAQPVQTVYLVSADQSIIRNSADATSSAAGANAGAANTTGVIRRELRNRVLIFAFDLNHLSADGYRRSKTAVENFLKTSALPSDLVGVLAGTSMLTNKISADKAPILEAMKSMKGPNLGRLNDLRSFPKLIDDAEAVAIARGSRETVNRAVQRACSEQPGECTGPGGDEPVRQQVESKARQISAETLRDSALALSTLGTLTNGLGRFPGSKQVLLFSDGFFTGELQTQVRAVVELAARNNVRFSTLDSRGLNKDPRMQNMMGAQPLTPAGDMTPLSFDENADAMATLAVDTGGEMVQNRNNLEPGIDFIAKTTGTYYVLGYSPSKALDGSFRRIEVKVVPPGLTIRARKGYIATPQRPGLDKDTPDVSPDPPPVKAAATSEPATKPDELAVKAPELPVPTPEPSAAPGVRPNADRNVDALTRISPAGAATAARKLADAGWDAYSKGDVGSAQKSLSAAVQAGDLAPWVSYALGFSEYALGHFDAALTAWKDVRAKVPEFMPVYFDEADAYISLGRNTDALAILRVTAKRWPDQPEAQNALGALLVRRGALDEAIDVFATIASKAPADSLGFFNLGRAYHLRYLRLQQNVAAARLRGATGIGDDDRKKAIAAYKQYLVLGGPFEKEARDAAAALDWKTDKPA